MIPALSITVLPAVLILAVAYPLRPQYGRQRAHPVPAPVVLARLAADPDRPGTSFGTDRPGAFTVQTRRLWRDAP